MFFNFDNDMRNLLFEHCIQKNLTYSKKPQRFSNHNIKKKERIFR